VPSGARTPFLDNYGTTSRTIPSRLWRHAARPPVYPGLRYLLCCGFFLGIVPRFLFWWEGPSSHLSPVFPLPPPHQGQHTVLRFCEGFCVPSLVIRTGISSFGFPCVCSLDRALWFPRFPVRRASIHGRLVSQTFPDRAVEVWEFFAAYRPCLSLGDDELTEFGSLRASNASPRLAATARGGLRVRPQPRGTRLCSSAVCWILKKQKMVLNAHQRTDGREDCLLVGGSTLRRFR